MDYFPENVQPIFEANHLLDDKKSLRREFDARGYLFFRDIVPVDKLLKLRRDMVKILAKHGWIEGGEDVMRAKTIGFPYREGEDGFFDVHDEIVKLESFHSLPHDENILGVMQSVLGEFPNNPEVTTPPHQDFPNNQGSKRLTAAWMPLSNCPAKLGSLAILEGSHKRGVLPLKFHLGPGNRQAALTDDYAEFTWVGTNFRLGDMVIFGPTTVHAAQENRDPERMRLSVDFRFQCEGEDLTEGCLKPHFDRISWDEIYKDWQSDELKYYWKKKDYNLVPWNPDLHKIPKLGFLLGQKYENDRKARFEAQKPNSSLTAH